MRDVRTDVPAMANQLSVTTPRPAAAAHHRTVSSPAETPSSTAHRTSMGNARSVPAVTSSSAMTARMRNRAFDNSPGSENRRELSRACAGTRGSSVAGGRASMRCRSSSVTGALSIAEPMPPPMPPPPPRPMPPPPMPVPPSMRSRGAPPGPPWAPLAPSAPSAESFRSGHSSSWEGSVQSGASMTRGASPPSRAEMAARARARSSSDRSIRFANSGCPATSSSRVPWPVTRPSSRTSTVSASSRVEDRWATMTVVMSP